MKNKKKILMAHLTDVLSIIMGRWIWPYTLHSLSMFNCNLLLYCQSKATQPLFQTTKVSNFINYNFFLQLIFLQKQKKKTKKKIIKCKKQKFLDFVGNLSQQSFLRVQVKFFLLRPHIRYRPTWAPAKLASYAKVSQVANSTLSGL